ncbi:MAG: PilZ domain-containing protein [Bdellovibrionales bacterium]|nr:PilZ domain-containing protein [Bdellovibrionales bacterium]
MSFDEKRKSLRIPVTAKVQISKEDSEGVYFTEDLSKGGFQIKMDDPPYVGTLIKAQISLPDVEELIEAKCEVVWRQEGKGCGVKFKIITKANLMILEEFLEGQGS